MENYRYEHGPEYTRKFSAGLFKFHGVTQSPTTHTQKRKKEKRKKEKRKKKEDISWEEEQLKKERKK